MATHSRILVWKIPWTKKLGGLQPMGSKSVGHDWAQAYTHICQIGRGILGDPTIHAHSIPSSTQQILNIISECAHLIQSNYPFTNPVIKESVLSAGTKIIDQISSFKVILTCILIIDIIQQRAYTHTPPNAETRNWFIYRVYISMYGKRLVPLPFQIYFPLLSLELSFSWAHGHLGRWQRHPTPVLLAGKSHGRRSLVGCSPWGRGESDTTERLHFYFSLSCTGEGNGNPLQCSCLENPRDRGAWWASVYGAAQSRTRLKWLSSSSSSMATCLKTTFPMLPCGWVWPSDFVFIVEPTGDNIYNLHSTCLKEVPCPKLPLLHSASWHTDVVPTQPSRGRAIRWKEIASLSSQSPASPALTNPWPLNQR